MRSAVAAALCLLLISPSSSLQSKQGGLPSPLAPPHVRELQGEEETARLDTKQTCRCDPNRRYTLDLHISNCCMCLASLDKGNTKVGLFIAACAGTFALMAAVYCIYTKFYTKQQYLHTQLNNDSGKCVDFCNTVNGL